MIIKSELGEQSCTKFLQWIIQQKAKFFVSLQRYF